ncbi:LacI family DNA-binding transcriptional regulator [Leifsonia sp. SIMBA_070]|uniref:LacI family DNA-binding transcriptional regulator n=1 Tax=Leifsonia sp. SIMBA_070 TaxID=3085810 RepID=UPI00397B078D
MSEVETAEPARVTVRRPPATIYDVAKATGVSPSTVSRALNKPGRLNAATEQRIREAADALGYRINPMARALPTGKTGTLALLLSDITNPVYFDLVRGAERVATENGLTLVFAESQESPELELATAERIQTSVDGLFLVASRLADEQIAELAAAKPLVVANRQVPGVPDIIPDPRPGISSALDELRERGHRRIAYLSGPETSWMNEVRWRTLFQYALDREMSIVEIASVAPTLEGGGEALPRVLAADVSAVFAYNDLLALGLLRAARDRDLDVPRKLSVVGFDDIFGADLTTPALSTIKSPLREAGAEAVRRLLEEISGSSEGAAPSLPTRYISRESVADLREGRA